MTFQLTDAGRAAIADSANRRTRQVVLTRMVVGDGLALAGVDDGSRTTLRNERQRQNLTAVAGGAARIAVRASFAGMMGDPVWDATEVGLIAQLGADPEFLAAYGAVQAGDDAVAVVAPGVEAVIAATVDIVISEANVAVAVTPNLTVAGASTFQALLDTPADLTPGAYYRGNAAGTALLPASASAVLSDVLTGLAAGSYPRVRVAGGVRSLEGLTAANLAAAFSRRWTLAATDSISSNGWNTVVALAWPTGWQLRCGFSISASPSNSDVWLRVIATDTAAELWVASFRDPYSTPRTVATPEIGIPAGGVTLQANRNGNTLHIREQTFALALAA